MGGEYTVFAVKAVQPWEKESGADYWIPLIYEELKRGNARFGWSYSEDHDLRKLRERIERDGIEKLSEEEREVWSHARFLIDDVSKGDFFIYINMPKYGECSLVEIVGDYYFTEVWDKEGKNDFRHCLKCNFISAFNRRSNIVPPRLKVYLSLPGAHYRIYAKEEFEELLSALKEGKKGKEAKERLNEDINKHLEDVVKDLHKNFPRQNLEVYLAEVFKRMPNVLSVRKGPDKNGADLEIEFESGIPGLIKREFCAVQVKSYEKEVRDLTAVNDIRRAFESDRHYTCGLIVMTATSVSEEFMQAVEELIEESGKPVGVIYGTELAELIIRFRERNLS
ncbi:hypothetical protein DRJ16_04895 [Candidatus Woesearchaeota archaeon]|nr:MAG: hypothetical protein DRJ16_04895 [Candidatus Woesearchaeota archaeon]